MQKKNSMAKFHSLTVSAIDKITPNAVAITFSIPAELKNAFSFKAGQYITIKHSKDGAEIRRAYSICSSPNSDTLTVGVKKVVDGTFSVFANEKLIVGTVLEVMPPEGLFIIEPEATNNYMAFAAGSGITPILSIVKATLEANTSSQFVLVYGNQSKEETMFSTEIEILKANYPNRFFIEYLYSRKQEEGARFGRIERSTINFFTKNKYKETSFSNYYLCGPEPMINEVSETLQENGVAKEQIHFELFTTTESDVPAETLDGTTKITITVDDETESFSMPQGQTILEAALEEGLDAPYSCQGGICSTCIARVVEGKAEMQKNQILTDGEVAEGLILTCQAHPITASIVVDYDDV